MKQIDEAAACRRTLSHAQNRGGAPEREWQCDRGGHHRRAAAVRADAALQLRRAQARRASKLVTAGTVADFAAERPCQEQRDSGVRDPGHGGRAGATLHGSLPPPAGAGGERFIFSLARTGRSTSARCTISSAASPEEPWAEDHPASGAPDRRQTVPRPPLRATG